MTLSLGPRGASSSWGSGGACGLWSEKLPAGSAFAGLRLRGGCVPWRPAARGWVCALEACGSGMGVCLGGLRLRGCRGDHPCAVTRPAPRPLRGPGACPPTWVSAAAQTLSGPPPRPAAVPPGSAGNDSAAPPPLHASPFPCSDSGLLASEIRVPGDQGAPTSFQKWELRFSAPIF